jgi:tRNA dimethylallyltransferase
MIDDRPKMIVIAGPTASGKTGVGIELAQKCNGEIISADSIQIYRYLDIGSAKPTAEERARAVHHMIDIRDPDHDFSAGEYVKAARQCVESVLARGLTPVVVGGTGLYIRLLLGGIADLPEADPEVRRRLRSEEEDTPGTLFERLLKEDPEAARKIHPDNLPRIIRALEILELTGRQISQIQSQHSFHDRPYDFLFIGLMQERKLLYERIDKRVDCMIHGGLLEEVAGIYARGYSRTLKPMQSLGYRHAGMVLAGEMEETEAMALMKRDTRRYAKRQLTWFGSEPEVMWFEPDDKVGIGLVVDNFLGR